ncbi:peptidoglycan DD-metalloendopeptidase family protein [Kitasatospora sp. NPDC059327]|uniref:peptidoglycan DD-metalloendopeptidase family protein n=1 Tax=Kitasatospora sp. NPDC059327 TaxID=3346803 RepID=UPI0036881188
MTTAPRAATPSVFSGFADPVRAFTRVRDAGAPASRTVGNRGTAPALPPPPGPGPDHRLLLLALLVVTAVLLTVLPGSVGHAAGVGDGVGTGVGEGVAAGTGAGRVWPVGAPGGPLRRFEAPATPWAAGHRGVDLAAGVGADIRSAAPGVVSFSGLVAGRPVVTVTHPASGTPPLRTTYLPVTAALTTGTTVTAGQVLGQLAPGAAHCGGHDCLHWGLLRGDRYLDPLALFGAGATRLLPLGRGR